MLGSTGLTYLNERDPGTYRAARGKIGADPLMAPNVGTGGRYIITTGEASAVNGATAALPDNWRRALDPHSPAFAVIVLGAILLLIHARLGANFGVHASVAK